MIKNLSHNQRRMLVTFTVAGITAIVGEHFIGPKLKGKLRV